MLGTFFRRMFGRGAELLKVGDVAPAFEAQDHTGRLRRSSEFAGQRVCLWFFPKASTPG